MRQSLGPLMVSVFLGATTAAAQWTVTLPRPTGIFQVGSTRFALVDTTRPESLTEDPGDRRELLLRVWYPAQPAAGARPEPFWGRETQELATRMAAFMRLPPGSFDDLARAPSHAYPDAPVAASRSPYPVLVFSHGYIPGLLSQNTAQMEELASHGYVVVSIGHTYETLANVFPDGRVAPFSQTRLAAFGQGAGTTRELTARYAAAADPAVKDSLIRRIAADWTVLDESLRIWTADTRFVLDELERMNAPGRRGLFSGRLDPSRIGVFGMSFGGATAGQVCLVDARCRAGINLDGMQFGDLINRPLKRPFMFMQSEDAGTINRLFFERATDTAYYVTVKGAKHFNFSDFSLFSPDFQKAGVLGSIEGERMERIINEYTLAFFDKYLKGKAAALLARPPAHYPEVEFSSRTADSGRSRGADPAPPGVDAVFERYDRTQAPGCALGVIREGRLVYGRGYGMADLNQGVPIRPSTVFYIASTSKQFTAFAIALLVEDGRVSLDDPVRKWIPELAGYTAPVTIRHLVHHTSGIRDYLGLWSLSGRSFADEIPQEVGLDLIARQDALDFEPGSRWSYSNSGYLLLSEIVKRASGKSLRQFTSERMFLPLDMTDTHFHDDHAMVVPHRAEGYQPSAAGGFQIVRTSFALVGDGGLMTTVEDLAKWERNFGDNRLGRGGLSLIDQVTTVGHTSDGKPLSYAFGLTRGTHRGLATIDHGGAFIGFRAQLLRFPTERLAVAVLCNDYTANPDQLARRVAELYLADRLGPAGSGPAPAGAAVSADRLERWVGSYLLSPGAVGRVTRDTTGLVLGAFGARARMVPLSDSVFTAPPLPGEVVFRTGASGPMMLTAGLGMTVPAPRLPPAPRLSAAEAAGYAGRYRTDELDSWAVVEALGDSLKVRARWSEWRTLDPITRDIFVVAGTQVAFDRDRRGRVTGYRLSAARTLNVRFRRDNPPPR